MQCIASTLEVEVHSPHHANGLAAQPRWSHAEIFSECCNLCRKAHWCFIECQSSSVVEVGATQRASCYCVVEDISMRYRLNVVNPQQAVAESSMVEMVSARDLHCIWQ